VSDSTERPAEEDAYSWQERFRDALSRGDEQAVASALREVDSLDRSGIEALASLFDAGAKDHGVWGDLYQHKLVFRPRGRLARRRGSNKNNGSAQTEEFQFRASQQAEITSDADLEAVESSPEQRFRAALSKADVGAVAAALREISSLDRSAVDALVYLFDVSTKDQRPWKDLHRRRLVFRRKRRGAPKDLEKHWVRDPQIAAFVERNTDTLRKIAVSDAGTEFELGRSSIFSVMARKGSPNSR
jgi:hypothetical protein